jgi:oligopeptide/dipeptide ABC transporter ATP-binding protein
MARSSPLIEIRNLHTYFDTYEGIVKAIEGVNLEIKEKEFLGLVGETGCGKSALALSILRLIPSPPGRIVYGNILFHGEDLIKKSEKEMRSIRGKQIAMIFQEPMSSINPVFKIGNLMTEIIMLHQNLSRKQAIQLALQNLEEVNIPDPERVINQYSCDLSGGMRQRVMIAMAISCLPELLIADEPTTALDVTIQIQILNLLRALIEKMGSSIMIISHDLGVIAEICHRVSVMYAGHIVEIGSVELIFESPMHPYTRGLIKAIPKLNEQARRLSVIEGVIPNLISPPAGCRFHPRCGLAKEECKKAPPPMREIEAGHWIACHHV